MSSDDTNRWSLDGVETLKDLPHAFDCQLLDFCMSIRDHYLFVCAVNDLRPVDEVPQPLNPPLCRLVNVRPGVGAVERETHTMPGGIVQKDSHKRKDDAEESCLSWWRAVQEGHDGKHLDARQEVSGTTTANIECHLPWTRS